MMQWRENETFGALRMKPENLVAALESKDTHGKNHESQDELEDFMGLCVMKRFLGIESISPFAGNDPMEQG